MPDLPIPTGARLLFTGDSITDCGRRGEHGPLGCGYVRHATDLIRSRHPRLGLDVRNTGIGGNNVRDLLGRMTDDILWHEPDWLSIMIGVNDLTQFHASSQNNGTDWAAKAYPPDEYAAQYDELLTNVKSALPDVRLVLMAPFFLTTEAPVDDPGKTGRGVLLHLAGIYGDHVARLAEKHDAILLRPQAMFERHLPEIGIDPLSNDAVHLTALGALFLGDYWVSEVMKSG
jgi:lysophospholipase L1-like esterase